MRKEVMSSVTILRLMGGSSGSALISWSGEERVKLCKVGAKKEALIALPLIIGSHPPLLLMSASDTPAIFFIIVKSMAKRGALYVRISVNRFQGTRN